MTRILGVSRFNIFGKVLLISFFVGVGLVPPLRPYGTKARGCETFLAPAGRHVYSTAGLPSCLAPAGRHVSDENQKLMGNVMVHCLNRGLHGLRRLTRILRGCFCKVTSRYKASSDEVFIV